MIRERRSEAVFSVMRMCGVNGLEGQLETGDLDT